VSLLAFPCRIDVARAINIAAQSENQQVLIESTCRVYQIVINAEWTNATAGNVWNEGAGQRRVESSNARNICSVRVWLKVTLVLRWRACSRLTIDWI
jgi:hypothetical protein